MKKFKKVIAIALLATIFGTTATATTASAHHCRTTSKKYYHDNCPYKNCNRTARHTHNSRGHCYR